MRASPLLFFALCACGPATPGDAGASDAPCSLTVEVGAASDGAFHPFADGDDAEIVLGFQGFQMFFLDVRITGAPLDVAHVEISGFVAVTETGIEASRIDRAAIVEREADALRARGWILFFNEAPLSSIAGHEGELEVVVHAGHCVGGARARVALVDRDDCVDLETRLDAGLPDGGLPDGSVACGAPP